MQKKSIFLDGEKIKNRRISLSMSQVELAKDITTQATISLMENKNRIPNIVILLEILSRLNLNFDILSSKKSDEQEIEAIFIRLLVHEDLENSASYQLEKQKIKSNQTTDFYKYIILALDHFYARKPDYFESLKNLELAVNDSQFEGINNLSKYVIYQYLALCKNCLGFVEEATSCFYKMITNEPSQDVIDYEQFKCVLKVRSHYIDFLIERNDYELSEYYITDSLTLCQQKSMIYLVPNFYRQLANIQNHKGENDLFIKYRLHADIIDSFLAL